MVKPDVKHNYYADLELPTTASLDDIRKQYRKLALQYHPDRNSGREDECVPKFQAIQAAIEVLGEPDVKQKYDVDRRKAGLYPTFGGGGAARKPAPPGNPYTANSAYPPPPRRTQAGGWQRPAPAGGMPPPGAANGADRFTNFGKPPPTAKKEPPPSRTNVFEAWKNMGAQNPQQRYPQPHAQPSPQPPPQPTPQARAPRPGPPPPPRQEPNVPTEEQIRAGMKYRKAGPPPSVFDPNGIDQRQSAWQAFQQAGPGKPGLNRSNTTKPPAPGFNANVPGPGERPTQSRHVHRNKSADFGRPHPGVKVPPPPAGGPPTGTAPTTPHSPLSPTSHRPYPDPTRPFSSGHQGHQGHPGEQVPFAEGTRIRTPYTSFIGEKTKFSDEGLRRSYSTRDTTKLSPDEPQNRSRARSSSPPRAGKDKSDTGANRKPDFDIYSSSEASSSNADMDHTPDEFDSSSSREPQRPGTAPNATNPFDRPKKMPTPPSSRYHGPTSPPPPMPGTALPDGAQSEGEQPSMQEKATSNMYAHQSPFSSSSWTSPMFGSRSTPKAKRVMPKFPSWAIPSSVSPVVKRVKLPAEWAGGYVTAADELYKNATEYEQQAYLRFQSELQRENGCVPGNLDMDIFFKLASNVRSEKSCGEPTLDSILIHVLLDFPTVGFVKENNANEPRTNSFGFPYSHNRFGDSSAKSRSEEHINTNFSPDGWTGAFTGEPDYFAPPQSNGRKPSSSSKRTTSNKSAGQRASTFDVPNPTSVPEEEVPQRRWGSDGTPNEIPRMAEPDQSFRKEDWERRFQDASWTWPPPPPNPPSPVKGAASTRKQSQSRRGSRKATGTKQQPHGVDAENDNTTDQAGSHARSASSTTVQDDGDAMDIDTPPSQQQAQQGASTPTQANGARPYAVPPSAWRQQHESQRKSPHRKTSSATRRAQRASAGESSKFNANLDELRDAVDQPGSADGGFNLGPMGSSLPNQSQAASTVFTNPLLRRELQLPQRPKIPEGPHRLTKTSWPTYAAKFGLYTREFHDFNSKMLHHFQWREQQAQTLMHGGMGWLQAAGDTSGMSGGPTGFADYLQGIEEDKRVRELWSMVSDEHANAVRGFEGVRERVRKAVMGGGLPE